MIEEIHVVTADGRADALCARPDDDPARPAILFYMDVFGLRPRLREMAETYAGRGYRVLVPNLFYRQGRAPFADPMGFLRATTPEMYVRDAKAYLDFFGEARVLVVGYCLGGAVGLRTAAAYPGRVAGLASFHAGRLATDDPASPHRLAPKIECPLHVVHADHDPSMPPEEQRQLARAFEDAGVEFHAETYPGCKHGFTMSDRDVFDPAGCERHWREVFAFFDGVAK